MKNITKTDIKRTIKETKGELDCCVPICISLLMGCSFAEAPQNLYTEKDGKAWLEPWLKKLNIWAAKREYTVLILDVSRRKRVSTVLRDTKRNGFKYYILTGETQKNIDEKKGDGHAVLCKADKVIFDPMYMHVNIKKYTKADIKYNTLKRPDFIMFFVPFRPGK